MCLCIYCVMRPMIIKAGCFSVCTCVLRRMMPVLQQSMHAVACLHYNWLVLILLLTTPPSKKKKDKPCFPCPTFDRLSYLKKLWKKLKRQVTHKILIMFYHLTTMKIWIIKKFHIRRTVKVGHGNSGFAFFFDGGSTCNNCRIRRTYTAINATTLPPSHKKST